jgi:hypothetical protein
MGVGGGIAPQHLTLSLEGQWSVTPLPPIIIIIIIIIIIGVPTYLNRGKYSKDSVADPPSKEF